MARTLLFVISCLLCQISWAEQHAKVLLLNSYHAQYRWTEQLTKGVQDTLSGKVHQENLHVEFMDARRFVDDPAYDKMMVDLLRHKYRQYRPDVVITADDHAYYFMIEHGQQLFGDTPIVFCGVNVFYPETREGKPHMVGIQEGMDIMGNLELITRLQPEVRRIVMLGDRTGLGARMIERANVIKARWRTNPDRQPVVLETWDNFVLQDLYEQAATMSLDTAFLMLAIHKDANGQYFSFDNELRVLTEASKVPVYGMWGALMIGNGVVGGNMNSPYQHGSDAAKIALEILQGKPVEQFGVRASALYSPYFDFTQLQRFDIDLARLPENSVIVNRPSSVYEKHRDLINSVIALVLFLNLVISVLLVNIRQRKAAQARLKQFNQELESIVEQRTADLEHRNEALQMASEKMALMAHSDSLTGLPNRRAGVKEIKAFIQRFSVQYQPLSIALGDIDLFKQVNDTYGHQAGDDVLCMVADVLSGALRPHDRVYRWGGEEFLIALPDTEMDIALEVCERLRQTLAQQQVSEVGHVSVSIGLSAFEVGDSMDSVVNRADKALYEAKRHGRNQVVCSDQRTKSLDG